LQKKNNHLYFGTPCIPLGKGTCLYSEIEWLVPPKIEAISDLVVPLKD